MLKWFQAKGLTQKTENNNYMSKEDDYMKKKILMMVLAMTMLAGCGAKEATPTDAGVSQDEDIKVEASVEETYDVVVDENGESVKVDAYGYDEDGKYFALTLDGKKVYIDPPAGEQPPVVEEPSVEEPVVEEQVAESPFPEVPTLEDFDSAFLYNILMHEEDNSWDAKDEAGNTLYSVTTTPNYFYMDTFINNDNGGYDYFDKKFEYVDIDGEKWLQVTFVLPEDARAHCIADLLAERGTDFVLTYSPDFFKVMYNGVVYSASQDYIDFMKPYSPFSKDYNEFGDCINPYYDENGNVLK